jgi:hypothetical protein
MKKNGYREPASFKTFTITGLDARIIMGDDEEALRKLWRRKRGEAGLDPEDALFSELAKASVAANCAQFERRTGRKLAEGEKRLRHPRLRWMGAILDGRLEDGALLEAKFAPASLLTAASARAMFLATAQHDLWVAQAKVAALSVVTGDGRWFEASIDADPLYQHLLLTAEKRFLRCLESGDPPTQFLLEAAASEAGPLTIVDMSSSREWAQAARQFRATARAHAEHEHARTRLAQLLPPEAFRASAAGVVLERAPVGGLRFAVVSEAAHA